MTVEKLLKSTRYYVNQSSLGAFIFEVEIARASLDLAWASLGLALASQHPALAFQA